MNATHPSDKLRVFLVEDTADLREELVFGLTALGLQVQGFADAHGLYRAMAVQTCDMVVIDVGLPGEDGFSIATHLRVNPALGIIFLTARATLDDRLHGLGLGADSYLVKPIDVRELAANLFALGRRLHPQPPDPQAATAAAPATLPEATRWVLSSGNWVLQNPTGCELTLSDTERRFMSIMMSAAHQVVERETLIAAFAQDDPDYDPHRLEALISRLRKRTEQAGLGSLPLQAIRGTGYVLNA